jgi:restriction system protein
MPMPDFQSVMLPLLQPIADGREHSVREATEKIEDVFHLTEDERQELLPSGQTRVIVNRVGWAKTYLKKAELIQQSRRGFIQITEQGKAVLAENPARVDMAYLRRFPSYASWRENEDLSSEIEPEVAIAQTPDERIDEAYNQLREALADELLQQVKDSSDAFFERLVVELLVAMGYGGSIEDAGRAVGRTGDGGIDGVIKEDKLGLDAVVIQAKKWTSRSVGRPDVQSFAGSMEGFRANKGVFITTSTFAESAREYVKMIQRKIVLIDGPMLAGLMIDHDIGVTKYRDIRLKRLDSDYFETNTLQ